MYVNEILYEDGDFEDDLDSILLIPLASTIPKRRTFKLLMLCRFLNDWWMWMNFCM
jgi:hypothetical protein